MSDLQTTIEAAFEARDTINFATKGAVREAVNEALNLLELVGQGALEVRRLG